MKISILSAAHNEEKYIADMIESVLGQTHTELELLIVNDRSSDRTAEIARTFAGRDGRVILVHSDDIVGKNAAWNRAFEASTGDVIIYMGADDVLPPDSLKLRAAPLNDVDTRSCLAATFSKVRQFSDNPKFDGSVFPRGNRGSRAGGALTMSRALAELIFPLSTVLPNEDVWSSMIMELRAKRIFEVLHVVYDGRIHSGNSSNHGGSFEQMNMALHARGRVYQELLDCDRFDWNPSERKSLERRRHLEELRHAGRVAGIVSSRGINLKTRLSLLSHSSRGLYALRQRFYKLSSGW